MSILRAGIVVLGTILFVVLALFVVVLALPPRDRKVAEIPEPAGPQVGLGVFPEHGEIPLAPGRKKIEPEDNIPIEDVPRVGPVRLPERGENERVALIPPPPEAPTRIPRAEMPTRPEWTDLPAAGPRPTRLPRPEAIKIPRRRATDEATLAKRLEAVPEISLYTSFTLEESREFVKRQQQARQAGIALPETIPDPLLERAGLPVLRGEACKLSYEAAFTLQEKSVVLRELLTGQPATRRIATLGVFANGGGPVSLSDAILHDKSGQDWLRPQSVPVLMQMLMAEPPDRRKVLLAALARIDGPAATMALAQRACFDLDPDCRLQAVRALSTRPPEQYVGVLMRGLRYPWDAIADHAAEALAALQRKEVVPGLLQMLDLPDPSAPFTKPRQKGQFVREMVRINHFRGCVLCHAVSLNEQDLVRGTVPTTDVAINEGPKYYQARGAFITAQITYLRQDFSLPQIVRDPGNWPETQRFDFLTRERPATPTEINRKLEGKLARPNEPAIFFALQKLTGENPGPAAEDWKKLFLNKSVTPVQVLQKLTSATALCVDEVGTALVAEEGRILRLPRDGAPSEWLHTVAPVRDLTLDGRGGLWLAYDQARTLTHLDLHSQKRTADNAAEGLFQPQQLVGDKHRGLYIVQGDGSLRYRSSGGNFSTLPLGKLKVRAAALNAEGDALYLASGKDIWRATVRSAGVLDTPTPVATLEQPISSLAVDNREVVVAGHLSGVEMLSPEGLRLGSTPLPAGVRALALRDSHAFALTGQTLYRIELTSVARP
jgi:hypothetical protein